MKDEEASPRILGVRLGFNPNSSSLGVDVTYLLFGGTAAVAIGLVLSAWLKRWRGRAIQVGNADREESR